MIFAREVSDPLVSLIKELNKATEANKAAKMGSFVVFLSDAPDLEAKLKDLIKKESIGTTVLSIDNPAGPTPYNVARDADVTVVLYTKSKVVANHAFKKGGLATGDVKKILDDVPKILGK